METNDMLKNVTVLTDKNEVNVLTIDAATLQWHERGANAVYPAYRTLITQMIDSGRQTEFNNDSYLDALFLTDLMLHRAQKEIRFLSGAQADGFLASLKDALVGALERIKKNNGFVRVILLGNGTPPLFSELKTKYEGTFDFSLAKANAEVQHFISCDSILARLEEPHAPLTGATPADKIRAKVYFNEPEQAKRLEHWFDYAWAVLRPSKKAS